jgi:hypothetical protein
MNMAISKFENYLCDIEDDTKGIVNKLIRRVAVDAYNNGVTDSVEATYKLDAKCDAQEDILTAAEKAICALYIK